MQNKKHIKQWCLRPSATNLKELRLYSKLTLIEKGDRMGNDLRPLYQTMTSSFGDLLIDVLQTILSETNENWGLSLITLIPEGIQLDHYEYVRYILLKKCLLKFIKDSSK